LVVTTPDDPALERNAWLGLVFSGDPDELLPLGFDGIGGECIGDPDSDDFCGHTLSFAQSVDDSGSTVEQWLVILGRFRGRDATGIAESEVVDVLYIEYPSGHDLTLQTECWAESDAHMDFGIGHRGCLGVPPLRAWYADWESETITEVPATSDLFCSDTCD